MIASAPGPYSARCVRRPPLRLVALAACTVLLVLGRAAGAQTVEYVIAPHDVFNVSVFGQPDVSGKFTVDADGSFSFPLLGRVNAAGLSPHALEEQIRTGLTGRFFRNPQVSVSMEQYRSQHVNVVGAVRQAGSYPLMDDMTVMDALARAGSTTDHAGPVAVITRAPHADAPGTKGSAAAPQVMRVDLRKLEQGTAGSDVILQDGDTVFVPTAETFFVSGHVRSPGSFPLLDQTTVLQAIALAGGLTERGTDRRVQIIRMSDGKRQTLRAQAEDLLQPGDTVVVRERLF